MAGIEGDGPVYHEEEVALVSGEVAPVCHVEGDVPVYHEEVAAPVYPHVEVALVSRVEEVALVYHVEGDVPVYHVEGDVPAAPVYRGGVEEDETSAVGSVVVVPSFAYQLDRQTLVVVVLVELHLLMWWCS